MTLGCEYMSAPRESIPYPGRCRRSSGGVRPGTPKQRQREGKLKLRRCSGTTSDSLRGRSALRSRPDRACQMVAGRSQSHPWRTILPGPWLYTAFLTEPQENGKEARMEAPYRSPAHASTPRRLPQPGVYFFPPRYGCSTSAASLPPAADSVCLFAFKVWVP